MIVDFNVFSLFIGRFEGNLWTVTFHCYPLKYCGIYLIVRGTRIGKGQWNFVWGPIYNSCHLQYYLWGLMVKFMITWIYFILKFLLAIFFGNYKSFFFYLNTFKTWKKIKSYHLLSLRNRSILTNQTIIF